MTLDSCGNILDAIEKMARDRGITLDLAPFHEIDTERRQLITRTEGLKAERNKASDEIADSRNRRDERWHCSVGRKNGPRRNQINDV